MNASDLNPSSTELVVIRAGDHTLFGGLLKKWLPAIHDLASGFTITAFDRDDYVQVGSLTLHEACRTYPLDGSIPFENYAPVAKNAPPKPGDVWHVGLNRCGGKTNEQYSQWSPSNTPKPAFHVPECFGRMVFSERSSPFWR